MDIRKYVGKPLRVGKGYSTLASFPTLQNNTGKGLKDGLMMSIMHQ